KRKPFSKGDAQAIRTPTLFIGGADTMGHLPAVTRALAPNIAGARTAMIPGARHWMFEQAPEEYCRLVMEFLAGGFSPPRLLLCLQMATRRRERNMREGGNPDETDG